MATEPPFVQVIRSGVKDDSTVYSWQAASGEWMMPCWMTGWVSSSSVSLPMVNIEPNLSMQNCWRVQDIKNP